MSCKAASSVLLLSLICSSNVAFAQAPATQPATGQSLKFADLNFQFTAPDRPWVQVDAPKSGALLRLD